LQLIELHLTEVHLIKVHPIKVHLIRDQSVSNFEDNPDEPKTLPPLELNPLTSPLLSQNMGRWAEVYFTSPPEKREQAIQALLRELEAEPGAEHNPESGDVAGEQRGSAGGDAAVSAAPSMALRDREIVPGPSLTNEAGTSFAQSETNLGPNFESNFEPNIPAQENGTNETGLDTDRLLDPIEYSSDSALGWAGSNKPSAADPARLFLDHPTTHRRNRVLTTAALALVVGSLFYVGWRETTAWLSVHEGPKFAAPETRPATAALPKKELASQTPEDAKANQAKADGASENLPGEKLTSKSLTSKNQAEQNQATQNQTAPSQSAQTQAAQTPGSGAEELAEAESYLNGTEGKPRDSSEAAEWLWKSVAKQNGVATMLLSDLYVRGEGVTKNCDQARLLLDAAARKGVPGAGERIRNLPSVGCP
jgi:hypothetical protein